jgi:tetratricopeptide (TPR) repeat protein
MAKTKTFQKDFYLSHAKSNYLKAVENDHYLFESYLGLGDILFVNGDFKSAESYYWKVIKLAPNTSYSAEAVKRLLEPEMLKVK